MDDAVRVSSVEGSLGYRFKDKRLLLAALTHSSYCNERSTSTVDLDELEWLGDSVLQLAVSSWLFCTIHGNSRSAGQLSLLRQRFVDNSACASFASKFNLQPYMRLGNGHQRIEGSKTLADCFEAVLGAVYLDAGGTIVGPVETILRRVIPSFQLNNPSRPGTKELGSASRSGSRQLLNLCHRVVQLSKSSGETHHGNTARGFPSRQHPHTILHEFEEQLHSFYRSILREGQLSVGTDAFATHFGMDVMHFMDTVFTSSVQARRLDKVLLGEAMLRANFPEAPSGTEMVVIEVVHVPKEHRLAWSTVIEFLATNLLGGGEGQLRAREIISLSPHGITIHTLLRNIVLDASRSILFTTDQRETFAASVST